MSLYCSHTILTNLLLVKQKRFTIYSIYCILTINAVHLTLFFLEIDFVYSIEWSWFLLLWGMLLSYVEKKREKVSIAAAISSFTYLLLSGYTTYRGYIPSWLGWKISLGITFSLFGVDYIAFLVIYWTTMRKNSDTKSKDHYY
ncbi:hypothetical protein MHBO_000808 [Bonamia ostreae]|uniref:Uncharacterized protein n=1 Tax=Bonamia ostreae TaxID=126728 RepID=A0ABV2AGV9_9EUKA